MEYLLLSVIALLISTISGDVEISIMKAVPRLNDSMYCDYYFACHAEGETLQWIVNNNNISDYSGQSVGQVFSGSISTCNYTTTLLSLKPMPPGLLIFDSVLIVSCRSSIDFIVMCTNGSFSKMSSSPEKGIITRAESNTTSVNLEHVLNENLLNGNSSSCTNIFVCGVDNFFMDWQIQKNTFTFTVRDNIGIQRHFLQDTTVEQQAILIGNESYSLIVAMIIIGSAEINVTCGYPGNTTSFATISCPTNLETTGSQTIGGSATTASESESNLPVAISVPLVVVVVIVLVAIFVIIGVYYYKKRTRPETAQFVEKQLESSTTIQPGEMKSESSTTVQLGEMQSERLRDKQTSEVPLKDNNFSGINKTKKRMSGISYNKFLRNIQHIFLTRDVNALNAATTIFTAPDIEKTNDGQLTSIENDTHIGSIGPFAVCLFYITEEHFVERLGDVIKKYFPNAAYLIFVERCFGLDPEMNLADIVISNGIHHATEHEACTQSIPSEIYTKLCTNPESVEILEVAEGRNTRHFLVTIAKEAENFHAKLMRKIIFADKVYGYVETSAKLFNIIFEDNEKMEISVIGAVTGFVGGETVNVCHEWQFMAFQAAFHYAASKIQERKKMSIKRPTRSEGDTMKDEPPLPANEYEKLDRPDM